MPTSDQLFARMKAAAIEMNRMDADGALHILVADGNCEDEDIEFCLQQGSLTPEERALASRLLEEFSEEERHGVWAFAQCDDLGGG